MATEHVIGVDWSISDAIVALLRDGPSHLLPDLPEAVAIGARAVIDEALRVPAHWDTTSAVSARVIVKGYIRRRHGDLDEVALEALGLHCTRDFRC